MRVFLIFGVSGFLVLSGCNESEDPDFSAVGYNYFPLNTGSYIDYSVSETRYFPDGSVSNQSYQLRVQVADSFPNEGGSFTYVLYRYRRPGEADPWQFHSTWSSRRENVRGITVEGNIPFLSLSFPVRNGLRWDGNILNASPPDTYQIDSLGDLYTIDGVLTENSLTVVQEDLLDFVIGQEDRRYEIYMEGIGLVEKGIRQLEFCTATGCGNEIESGLVYLQKATGYGTD